jgi:hypothetical protein
MNPYRDQKASQTPLTHPSFNCGYSARLKNKLPNCPKDVVSEFWWEGYILACEVLIDHKD